MCQRGGTAANLDRYQFRGAVAVDINRTAIDSLTSVRGCRS